MQDIRAYSKRTRTYFAVITILDIVFGRIISSNSGENRRASRER